MNTQGNIQIKIIIGIVAIVLIVIATYMVNGPMSRPASTPTNEESITVDEISNDIETLSADDIEFEISAEGEGVNSEGLEIEMVPVEETAENTEQPTEDSPETPVESDTPEATE